MTPAPVVGGGTSFTGSTVCFVALLRVGVKTHASRACASCHLDVYCLVAGSFTWREAVDWKSHYACIKLPLPLCLVVIIMLVLSSCHCTGMKLLFHWYCHYTDVELLLHLWTHTCYLVCSLLCWQLSIKHSRSAVSWNTSRGLMLLFWLTAMISTQL